MSNINYGLFGDDAVPEADDDMCNTAQRLASSDTSADVGSFFK